MVRLFTVLVLSLSGSVALACSYPGEPGFVVPDGDQATKEEMISTQGKVKDYVSSIEEYLGCLDKNINKESEEISEEQRQIYTLRYNAAVDAMNVVAEQFNVAVREYKAAQ